MGNHCIKCETCHEDLEGLGGGHAPGCPGEDVSPEVRQAYWERLREARLRTHERGLRGEDL